MSYSKYTGRKDFELRGGGGVPEQWGQGMGAGGKTEFNLVLKVPFIPLLFLVH